MFPQSPDSPPETVSEVVADPIYFPGTEWNVQPYLETALPFGLKVLGALAILILGWMASKLVARLVRRMLDRSPIDATLSKFLTSLVQMGVVAFVVIAAISKLGVETTSFVAILGAAGFAVGFALQGSLSNFAAGVMLMVFRPLKVGDLVEAGDCMGVVREVGIFATIINTLDNKRVVVSNSGITGGNIVNYTANGSLRVDMTFGIGYGDDVTKAMRVLKEIVNAVPHVQQEPAPDIAVAELGDNSVNLICRPWTHPDHFWDVFFETHKNVKLRFDEEGISIPFPQREVHMHQVA